MCEVLDQHLHYFWHITRARNSKVTQEAVVLLNELAISKEPLHAQYRMHEVGTSSIQHARVTDKAKKVFA